jgi:ABC-2 type transport system ATP-binding protein
VLAVETRQLCKSYAQREVLHQVDLRVPCGALYGFLGPNGAGKTTTLRILMGLLRNSGGQALIFGQDVWSQGPAVRAEVGYLSGDIRLYDRLTGRQTLAFLDAARRRDSKDEMRRLAALFDMDLDRRVRACSRGMKQKIGLIQALMHRPKLVVLDEPTVTLDPLVREALCDELRRVAAEGRTVLFSSHTLSEVEALCDRVGILKDGRLIEQESVDVLRRRALRHVEVRCRPGGSFPTPLPAGLTVTHRDGLHLAATWVGDLAPLLRWLSDQPVEDLTLSPPDLEDLFMAYYGGRAAATQP